MITRLSEYRIMWVLVFFDLPTGTKKERKAYSDFRDALVKDGFTMFQYSIYFFEVEISLTLLDHNIILI